MASAVCSASLKKRGRARVRLTFQFQFSVRHVDACETRAAREGTQRPCGSEESKYRQRCQGVQNSDGLGGQRFKLAISRPRGAAWARHAPGEGGRRNKQQTTTTIFFLLTLDIFRELYLGGRRGVRHICSEPLGKGRHRAGSFREFSRARRGGCLASCFLLFISSCSE